MAEWRKVLIGEICKTNCLSYSNKDGWKFVNYLDTGNITINDIDEIQFIDLDEEKLPSRAKRKVKYNSIIYSTVRPNQLHYGIIKSQPDNFLVSTGFTVIDVDETIADADFIYYWLTQTALTERLQAIAEQSVSAYPSIKSSDIEELEIELPPLDEQKKIAGILSSLDTKRRANNQINRNLSEQANAIFAQYYEQADDTALFSDRIKVLGGGTPKTGEESYWNGNIPFFTPKDVGTPYTFSTEKYISDKGLDHCNSRLYPKNTTFVTARGTVGKVGLAGLPMAMNQSCYALASDTIPEILVYFYTLEIVKSLKHKASGAVFDAIVTRDFDSEIIHFLNDAAQNSFLELAEPIFDQIYKNMVENRKLVSLRDSLLPRLMSGELGVNLIAVQGG